MGTVQELTLWATLEFGQAQLGDDRRYAACRADGRRHRCLAQACKLGAYRPARGSLDGVGIRRFGPCEPV